jgi:hypothetical protein
MISTSYLQTCFNLVLVAGIQKLIFAQKRLGAIKLQLNHDGHVTSQKVNFSSFSMDKLYIDDQSEGNINYRLPPAAPSKDLSLHFLRQLHQYLFKKRCP